MSFRCQNCQKNVKQNIPQAIVVTETRDRTYKSYFDGRYPIEGPLLVSCTENELKTLRCKETQGKEIVKQIACCPECELTLTGKCSYISPTEKVPAPTISTIPHGYTQEVPVEYISIPKRGT